eukprot:15358268-Ditylum_brightwellii.AAC.1
MALQAAALLLANKKPNRMKFQKQLERLMGLTSLPTGEVNEFHPLTLVAGTQSNLNALCHRDAMKSKDHKQFIKAMEDELKGYKSRQVDYVQAFPQAPLEDED